MQNIFQITWRNIIHLGFNLLNYYLSKQRHCILNIAENVTFPPSNENNPLPFYLPYSILSLPGYSPYSTASLLSDGKLGQSTGFNPWLKNSP